MGIFLYELVLLSLVGFSSLSTQWIGFGCAKPVLHTLNLTSFILLYKAIYKLKLFDDLVFVVLEIIFSGLLTT